MNGAATQVASREFDRDFSKLPRAIQANIQRKIDAMGLRLDSFPHYRMAELQTTTLPLFNRLPRASRC
jgi:hypothetical protein